MKLPFSLGKLSPSGKQCYMSASQSGIALAYRDTKKSPLKYAGFVQNHDLKALANLIEKTQLKSAECFYVLSPNEYRLFLIEAPKVPEEELWSASRWAIKDMIDFPVDQAVIEIFAAPGLPGQLQKIYVVASKLPHLQEIERLVASEGLILRSINIAELALNHLLMQLPDADKGIALLYPGAGCSHILIVRGKTVYLARRLEFDIKKTKASGENAQADYDHLMLELQRTSDYYQTQFRCAAPSKIYLIPTFAEDDALMATLSGGLEVSVGGLTVSVGSLDLTNFIKLESRPDDDVLTDSLLVIGEGLARQEGENE